MCKPIQFHWNFVHVAICYYCTLYSNAITFCCSDSDSDSVMNTCTQSVQQGGVIFIFLRFSKMGTLLSIIRSWFNSPRMRGKVLIFKKSQGPRILILFTAEPFLKHQTTIVKNKIKIIICLVFSLFSQNGQNSF